MVNSLSRVSTCPVSSSHLPFSSSSILSISRVFSSRTSILFFSSSSWAKTGAPFAFNRVTATRTITAINLFCQKTDTPFIESSFYYEFGYHSQLDIKKGGPLISPFFAGAEVVELPLDLKGFEPRSHPCFSVRVSAKALFDGVVD